MATLPLHSEFITHKEHRTFFRDRVQVLNWAITYPMIFDNDDLSIAMNQAKMGYHFHEWLAAVLLFHTEGVFSLVEQYQFSKHKRKREVLGKLHIDPSIINYMEKHPKHGWTQCPDLLVYEPDYSDWFFIEVKGPKDKVSQRQRDFFKDLAIMADREVKIVKFKIV